MRYIFIFIIFITYLFSAVQLQIANNKWQLLGVNGVYIDGLSPPIFGTSGIVATQSVNANGDVVYYDGANSVGSSIANDKTVGILLIEGEKSPTGNTELAVGTDVSFEIDTFYSYDSNQTRYRMYLAGKNDKPVIRIDFQANLIGKSFKVRFGTETSHYIAYFNPDNTFDSPQKLSDGTLAINTVQGTSALIDVFDINLSDNNLSDIDRNNASSYINKITATSDVNATFYTLTKNGVWALWDSRNTAGLNGFNNLTSGRGYWALVSNNSVANPSHGIILGDQGINDSTYNAIYNGWNLVSFRDSSIRYSPTGFFVPFSEFATGVSISYKASHDEINITSTVSTIDVARQINWNITDKREKQSTATNFIAYPASKIVSSTVTIDGVIVVSDDRMDINTSNASNLSGRELKNTNYGRFSTLFGDYMIGLELGQLNGVDMNQTINIFMPNYNSNTIKASDLNESANPNIVNSLILDALQEAAQSSVSTIPDANVSVYRVDINSTGTLGYDITLLSSTGRFSVQDGNFIRKYKLVSDGDAVIVGSQNRKINSINQINLFQSDTDVKYIDLLNDEFMITSNAASNLDILESSGYTMFLDEPTITDASSKLIAIGAIGKTYTHKNLLSPSVGYDNQPLVSNIIYNSTSATDGFLSDISSYTDDLSGHPMIALDFPSDGPLNSLSVFGKTITQILSATTLDDATASGSSLLWQITDLTKSPKDWFDISDTQDVFTIKKEKGYWINVKDFTSSSLSIDQSSKMSLASVAHFDNNITLVGIDNIGLVTNHINHKLSLKIVGLNPLVSTAYNLTAIIRGKKFPLIANGTRFVLNINDIDMGLEEATQGSTNDDTIKIQIYDGLGNSLTNTNYTVNFIKPSKPVITWGSDGEMSVESPNPYEIHNEPILDTSPRSSVILENSSDIYSSTKINWEDVDGNVTLLRLISKNNGVYSDMSITPFVPFKDAHILQVRNNLEVDKIPYSYISNNLLKKNNIETDNGVQITSLQDRVTLMAYRPEREGLEQLSSFAGTTTMYLAVGGVNIGYITYVKSYQGKYFYIYYNDTLYQGTFSDGNSFAIANAAYDLDSGSFDFANLSLLGNEGNEIKFNGFSSTIQPIYETNAITTPNTNINVPSGQQPQTGGITVPQPILPTN